MEASDDLNSTSSQWSKRYGKRLETIDGIEIASSYKEYIDLALGDLKDRLKKSKMKVNDFRERIEKRTSLLDEVVKEIMRRRVLALKFTEKDKLLRKRLIRNTEMRSAIQNLAEIAGYRLNRRDQASFDKISSNEYSKLRDDATNDDSQDRYESVGSKYPESSNETVDAAENGGVDLGENNEALQNNSYTVYIEMAYNQINAILTKDKQIIIDLIRRKKNNDFKLKELEKLRLKVSNSLVKLKEFDENLTELIKNDVNIENILVKLSMKYKQQANNSNIVHTDNLNNKKII